MAEQQPVWDFNMYDHENGHEQRPVSLDGELAETLRQVLAAISARVGNPNIADVAAEAIPWRRRLEDLRTHMGGVYPDEESAGHGRSGGRAAAVALIDIFRRAPMAPGEPQEALRLVGENLRELDEFLRKMADEKNRQQRSQKSEMPPAPGVAGADR